MLPHVATLYHNWKEHERTPLPIYYGQLRFRKQYRALAERYVRYAFEYCNTVSNRARTVLRPGPDTFPKTNGPDMKSGDYGLLSAFLKRSCYESFSDPLRCCIFGRVGFYRIPLYNWRITPYTFSCTLSLYGLYHCCNVLYDCLIADSMSSHYVLLMCSFLIKSAIVLESSTSTGRATIVAYPRLRNYSRAEVFHDKGLSSKAISTLDNQPNPRGRGITV